MTMFRNAFRWTDFYVVGFLTLVALPSEALAQVPNNSAVVSRFRLDGALMPDGGLTVVDLDNPANTFRLHDDCELHLPVIPC